ncbi:MAG: mechanosensitive ion channel family protein [Rubricoccaceae bacterium]
MQDTDTSTVAPGDTLANAIDGLADAAGATRDKILDGEFWFGVGQTIIEVALIIGLALLALAVVKRIKARWVAQVMDEPTLDKRRQRVLSVADLLGSLARYVIWTIATVMVLSAIKLDIGPLLAGAGIAGLAIGFGAQTLVKDVISGVFHLFDDTLGVGDLIRIGDEAGTVEYIGLRIIKVRKFDGELMMIPSGELRTFGNLSVGYARVVTNVGLAYEQNVDDVLEVLKEVATEWAESEAVKDVLLDDAPEVQAVLDLGDSAVQMRVVARVKPGEQFEADRSLKRLIKTRFDERGVEIPFPRRMVYVKGLSDGSTDAVEPPLAPEPDEEDASSS